MNETVEIQEALRSISRKDATIPLVTVDGVYGFQTQNAVSVFQQQYGLPVSGEVDSETWDLLIQTKDSATPRTPTPLRVLFDDDIILMPGSDNEILSVIKSMLAVTRPFGDELLPTNRSDVYDEETVTIIRRLRKLHDLEETDAIDYDLWEILANLYNTRQRYGREIL